MRSSNHFTKEEIDKLEELRHGQNLKIREISEDPLFKGRRSYYSIKWKLFDLKITGMKSRQLQIYELLQIMTRKQVADKLGITYSGVSSAIKKLRKGGFHIPKRARINYTDLSAHHKKYKTLENLLLGLGISRESYYKAIRLYQKKIGPIAMLPQTTKTRDVEKSYTPRFPKTQKKDDYFKQTGHVYHWSFRRGQVCDLPGDAMGGDKPTLDEMEQKEERNKVAHRKRNDALFKQMRRKAD